MTTSRVLASAISQGAARRGRLRDRRASLAPGPGPAMHVIRCDAEDVEMQRQRNIVLYFVSRFRSRPEPFARELESDEARAPNRATPGNSRKPRACPAPRAA